MRLCKITSYYNPSDQRYNILETPSVCTLGGGNTVLVWGLDLAYPVYNRVLQLYFNGLEDLKDSICLGLLNLRSIS